MNVPRCPTCSYWKTEAETQRKRADRNLKLVVQRDGEIKELCERIHDRDQKIQELAAEIELLRPLELEFHLTRKDITPKTEESL
jgi:hypothetical protein